MAVERIQLEEQRRGSSDTLRQAVEVLSAVLHLLESHRAMYERAADITRRRINSAFFTASRERSFITPS